MHHFSIVAICSKLAKLKLLGGTSGTIAAVTHESKLTKRETLENSVSFAKPKIGEKKSQQDPISHSNEQICDCHYRSDLPVSSTNDAPLAASP